MRREQFPDRKLLVEGESDLFAIAELRNIASLNDNFDIVVLNTITNLEQEINVRLKSSELTTLGIVIDADLDAMKIWNKIQKIFSTNTISLPTEIPAEGLIFISTSIKIGVWIMPNNQLNGTLEDFLHYLIPDDDLLMDQVEIHIQNIETKKLQKYNPNNRAKAKIHSWLALQESPGTPIGRAINYKYLKTENPECKGFINWLNKLYN